jgi:hypothetical protein
MESKVLLNIVLAPLIALFFSCNREAKRQCKAIKNVKISAPISVTVGDLMTVSAPEVGGFRIYNWDGPNFFDSQDPVNTIGEVGMRHRGTYKLHLYTLEDDACEVFDEVFVDVLLKQGNPDCSIDLNTTLFNNQGPDEYISVIETIDAVTNQKILTANGIAGTCVIYFHSSWNAQNIKTGIYKTTDNYSMDNADGDYNKVFIGITKNSTFWGCFENQDVYVTNNNGDLKIEFCNLNFLANNGSSLSDTVSGNIIEP